MRHPHPIFDAWHQQAALADVIAASHATLPLIRQRQRLRLQRLFEAAQGSALYRERMGSGTPELARMAPVTRGELMARFGDWVTDSALQLDELRSFIGDPARAGEDWLGRYVVWESSGTSGQPGVFVQDARAMAVYDALEATRHRATHWAAGGGLRGALALFDPLGIADRHALVVATGGHFASVVNFERLRRLNPWLSAHSQSFSVLQPLDRLVRALNDFQPTVLGTYPTVAALLADEAEAGRLRIAPRGIVTGGEMLSRAVRERVQRVFRAPVRSSYGTSEFLPIAWECAHGHLHVNADWVLLEPVDDQHRPVPPGERSHSVLLTNLANWVQPLIRYDLGDQVIWSDQPCRCGSALPLIEVQGRQDDVMQVPAERAGRNVSLLPLALCTVLEEECGVFDFQLRQHSPSTLVLRVPQAGEQAQAIIERCREALQQFARQQGAGPIQVLGVPGCELPRGRSGKACRVVMERAA